MRCPRELGPKNARAHSTETRFRRHVSSLGICFLFSPFFFSESLLFDFMALNEGDPQFGKLCDETLIIGNVNLKNEIASVFSFYGLWVISPDR